MADLKTVEEITNLSEQIAKVINDYGETISSSIIATIAVTISLIETVPEQHRPELRRYLQNSLNIAFEHRK